MSELEKSTSLNIDISKRLSERFENIRHYAKNLEVAFDENNRPSYLVAHGVVKFETQVSEIRTAISVRLDRQGKYDDIEFSTNVGQIPNSPFGSALVENLNHRFDGKFVTFDTENPTQADIVYVTRTPADWLDKKRLQDELEIHAKTHAIAAPILKEISSYGQLNPNLLYPEVKDVGRLIINDKLDLHNKLQNKFIPLDYLPKLLGSSEE